MSQDILISDSLEICQNRAPPDQRTSGQEDSAVCIICIMFNFLKMELICEIDNNTRE